MTITQIKPIRAGFTLAERDLAALRKVFARSPPAEVRVYAPGEDKLLATGTLDFVDSSVDFSSGTIAAKAKFANDKLELWPGMYVDVEVDLDFVERRLEERIQGLGQLQRGTALGVVPIVGDHQWRPLLDRRAGQCGELLAK